MWPKFTVHFKSQISGRLFLSRDGENNEEKTLEKTILGLLESLQIPLLFFFNNIKCVCKYICITSIRNFI